MSDISSEVQKEVARLRETIATTNALFPNGRVNWMVYHITIAEAERAVREQDATVLARMLPMLQEME